MFDLLTCTKNFNFGHKVWSRRGWTFIFALHDCALLVTRPLDCIMIFDLINLILTFDAGLRNFTLGRNFLKLKKLNLYI